MPTRSTALGFCAAWLLGILLLGPPGCSNPHHRVQDALDMADLGLTFSKKPKLAAFKGCAGAVSLGFGDVEGYFIGLGDGKLGVTPFSHEGLGLALWGKHKTRFGEVSKDDAGILDFQKTGILGLADGPIVGPDQEPACIQQVHVGWAGVVANAKWLQVADFLLGCTGIDICFDDGKRRGGRGGEDLVTIAAHQPEPAKTVVAREPEPAQVAKADVAAKHIPADKVRHPEISTEPASPKRKPEQVVVVAKDEPEARAGKETAKVAPTPILPPPKKAIEVYPAWRAARKYLVRKGDIGLMQIARVQLGDVSKWREIARLNHLEHPYVINIGQEILLPD